MHNDHPCCPRIGMNGAHHAANSTELEFLPARKTESSDELSRRFVPTWRKRASRLRSEMGATRAFSFTRQVPKIGAVPPSAVRRWRKNMASRIVKRACVENPPKSAASDDEWEIVQRAIAGDSEPLAALFACQRPRLYRTAFAVLRNREDAE